MRKLVQAVLFLARLTTLKYSLSASGGGVADQVDTFCSHSCLAAEGAEGAEAASGASESKHYWPYNDFSGTTPAHISPRHRQTYIYARVTGARR